MTTDLKFSGLLQIPQLSGFGGEKFISGIFRWSFDSKTAFLPLFGHTVEHQILEVLLADKSSYLVHLKEGKVPTLYLVPCSVIL